VLVSSSWAVAEAWLGQPEELQGAWPLLVGRPQEQRLQHTHSLLVGSGACNGACSGAAVVQQCCRHTYSKYLHPSCHPAAAVLQDSPFFTVKLGIKVLPAVVLFKGGVSVDRLVGFQQLGGRDDFSTAALEARLKAAGIVGGVRAGAAAAGGEESEDEEDQMAASIRRGIVHKGSDNESSDFDE
jgi:hypothetical protein